MKIEALNFYVDINGDGRYSGWELWEAVKWVYHLPGSLLIEGLGNTPYISGWLGIQASEATGYASFNNWIVVLFSLLFWLALLIFLVSIKHYDDDPEASPPKAEPQPYLRLPDGRAVRPLLENKSARRQHHRHRGHRLAGHHFK